MIVCSECGGTCILEFRLAGYDPNKYRDHDYDVPVKGGVDYPLEYTWCSNCESEHVDFIDEDAYNAKDNSTE
jgi:hypothetical protein